jgi:tetratricopeptide (TPR) repeat protein
MDGPRWLLLALGLAVGCGGCQLFGSANSSASKVPPPPQTARPTALPPVVPEKPVLTKTSNVPTEVAFGDWQLNAALGKDAPADKKEALLEAARKAYQKALDLDPTCLPACAGLAKVYMAYRQFDKALVTYQKGLERHPREASLWMGMGVCHLRRDDWPAALKCMKTAHDLDPENREYART